MRGGQRRLARPSEPLRRGGLRRQQMGGRAAAALEDILAVLRALGGVLAGSLFLNPGALRPWLEEPANEL